MNLFRLLVHQWSFHDCSKVTAALKLLFETCRDTTPNQNSDCSLRPKAKLRFARGSRQSQIDLVSEVKYIRCVSNIKNKLSRSIDVGYKLCCSMDLAPNFCIAMGLWLLFEACQHDSEQKLNTRKYAFVVKDPIW